MPSSRPSLSDTAAAHAVHIQVPPALRLLASSGVLLQQLECSRAHPDARLRPAYARQYRLLVQRVGELLADTPASAELDQLLQALPALAELYENLRYAQAGLCRAPLDRALHAELEARALIGRCKTSAETGSNLSPKDPPPDA